MNDCDKAVRTIRDYLGLSNRPVGIRLFTRGTQPNDLAANTEREKRHSFCWYVHQAANGHDFLIRQENLNCLNAEIVLGFKQPRFARVEPRVADKIEAISIGPLDRTDIIMFILNAEQAMQFTTVLSGFQTHFKKNRTVCGEGVARVFLTNEPNLSLLCLGARTKGDFQPHELLVSIPFTQFLELPSVMDAYNSLSHRAKDGIARQLLRIS